MIPINAIFRALTYFYEITANGEKWARLEVGTTGDGYVSVESGWKNTRANNTRRFTWNLKGEVAIQDIGHAS